MDAEGFEQEGEGVVVKLGEAITCTRLLEQDNNGHSVFETDIKWQERLARAIKLGDGVTPGILTAGATKFDIEAFAAEATKGSELYECILSHTSKIPAFLNGMCFCNNSEVFISEEIFHGTNPLKLDEIWNELLWLHLSNPYFNKKLFVFVFFDPDTKFERAFFAKRREWSRVRVCRMGEFAICKATDLGYYFLFGGPLRIFNSKNFREAKKWKKDCDTPGCDFLVSTALEAFRGIQSDEKTRVEVILKYLALREDPSLFIWSSPAYRLLAGKKFSHESNGSISVTQSWAIWSQCDIPSKHKIFTEEDRTHPVVFPRGRLIEWYDL